MAPKRGIKALNEEEDAAKRAKSSGLPASRSGTPAEASIPFEIKYPDQHIKASKRSKEEQEIWQGSELMVSPFVSRYPAREGELDQRYTVIPNKPWAEMKKYNNFIIQGETYKNNQFVFVKGSNVAKSSAVDDPKDFWIARILQVRAADPQHVYALVAWLYWPDELPAPAKKAPDQVNAQSGRRNYHGDRELVGSNYMEVLDVLSFAGKAGVLHWDEKEDQFGINQYWRQTFCRETQELSKIREHCVCKGHFNPEVPMEMCENPACKIWLHEECILDAVLTKTYDELAGSSKAATNGTQSKTNGIVKYAKPKAWKGKLKGKITPPKENSENTTISIIDMRSNGKGAWTERIPCLNCGTLLE